MIIFSVGSITLLGFALTMSYKLIFLSDYKVFDLAKTITSSNLHCSLTGQILLFSIETMAYDMLDAINNGKDSWKVKVRVIRLWDAINLNNNELISLDMILLDEQVSLLVKGFFPNINRSL